MRRMQFARVVVLLAVLAGASACGKQAPVIDSEASGTTTTSISADPASLGHCPEAAPGVSVDHSVLTSLFSPKASWVTATGLEDQHKDAGSYKSASGERVQRTVAKVVDPVTVVGDAASAANGVVVDKIQLAGAASAVGAKANLLIKVGPPTEYGAPLGTMVVAEFPDGTVSLIGECMFNVGTKPLKAFVADLKTKGSAQSEREVLRSLIADTKGAAFAQLTDFQSGRSTKTPDWNSVPVEKRVIKAGWTPKEVMDQLSSVELNLTIPTSWLESNQILCTRISAGWNEGCTRLDPSRKDEGAFLLNAFVAKGEPLDLVLINGDRFGDPSTKVGSLDPETLSSSKGLKVTIEGDYKAGGSASVSAIPIS